MNLISKIFGGNNTDCPRCLSKGHVDWDDIKRLNKELKWKPGKCAYCNGRGKVNSKIIDEVPIETTYLTIDLNKDERKRIIQNDADALARGRIFEEHAESFIKQVKFLNTKANMNPDSILEFFLIPENDMTKGEEEELLDYISRIVEHKN